MMKSLGEVKAEIWTRLAQKANTRIPTNMMLDHGHSHVTQLPVHCATLCPIHTVFLSPRLDALFRPAGAILRGIPTSMALQHVLVNCSSIQDPFGLLTVIYGSRYTTEQSAKRQTRRLSESECQQDKTGNPWFHHVLLNQGRQQAHPEERVSRC